MSLGNDFKNLLAQAGAMRQEMVGEDSEGEPQKGVMATDDGLVVEGALPFICYFTPIRSEEQLTRANFRDVHDTILRVFKSEGNFDPGVGKVVRLLAALPGGEDLTLRLSEIGIGNVNPEWVFGCKNL